MVRREPRLKYAELWSRGEESWVDLASRTRVNPKYVPGSVGHSKGHQAAELTPFGHGDASGLQEVLT